MSDTPDNTALVQELEDRAYTAIAYIIRQLATSYVEKIGDTLTVNDTMLRTMSQMVGEMIACYPADEQEDTHGRVEKTIQYSLDMMALELAERSVETETNVKEIKPAGKYDLATMKPQGNC